MSNAPPEVEIPPFHGTANSDIIIDDGHTPAHYGLGGNDVFLAHVNDATFNGYDYDHLPDYFHGGSGSDTASYILSDKKIVANLGTGIAHRLHQNQVQSTDDFDSIENLIGTAFGDSIYGSDGVNDLRGGGGNDFMLGQGGGDRLWGDSGNDTVDGGSGADSIEGGTGNDKLLGNTGADTVKGGDGSDSLEGGAQNDQLNGGAHADTLKGDGGDDRLEGGTNNDTLDGGAGTDTAVYTGAGAVMVNLWLGLASGAQGADTLVSIERAETGSGNDVVFGSFSGNKLMTGGGNDSILAFDGHDWVVAGSGADTVHGYEGNDLVYGGTGGDKLYGGENGDTLHGENGADWMSGDEGGDSLSGGADADRLRGGEGDDTINGGSGADIVVWQEDDDGVDLISGFSLAEDRLWFDAGFFAVEPVGAIELIDVLTVFDTGPHALLAANTAAQVWTEIATVTNVDAYAFGQMIANETILSAPVVNFGGLPGDVVL